MVAWYVESEKESETIKDKKLVVFQFCVREKYETFFIRIFIFLKF